MIQITDTLFLHENELEFDFVQAGGPGGQHVNRSATAVQLRFDVLNSPSLPDDVRERLIRLAGRRVTEEGILIISARRFRSQERNREDALERLVALIRKAAEKPKKRRKTRLPRAAKERRLAEKRYQSEKKRRRERVGPSED